MAERYSKKKLIEMSESIVQKNVITSITDLLAFLPISKRTFYNKKLHEVYDIKEGIDKNKVKLKRVALKNLMENADNPTAQIAVIKLLGTQEEKDALNGSKRVIEGSLDISLPKSPITIEVDDTRPE